MSTKRRREASSCTGRGFSAIDPDGYLAKLASWLTRPNINGSTQAITTITNATENFYLVGHGYVTGQSVVLTGTTAPTGLTLSISLAYPINRSNITEYFIIRLDGDNFQLAETYNDALLGTEIEFSTDGTSVSVTALGGGANWYLHDDFSAMEAKTFATTDVDVATSVITCTAHGFPNMCKVTFSSTGTLPAGIVAGTSYWIYRIDADSFMLTTDERYVYSNTYPTNITNQGSGTHTITNAEHFIVVTDTASPTVNDYDTSPSGGAPKFIKFGYVNSESGYVRMQGMLWWDNVEHGSQQIWTGYKIATYDSAIFVYVFIGGDEFMFIAAKTGTTWGRAYIDNFTRISTKLELATKVGVLQSGVSAGDSVVLQLASGEASNFTEDKFYYIYDFDGHSWVNYFSIEARDTVAHTITVSNITEDFPAGAVVSPYAHRYYSLGLGDGDMYGRINLLGNVSYCSVYDNSTIPYFSSTTQDNVAHAQSDYVHTQSIAPNTNSDDYLSAGAPDDEGDYDCMRLAIIERRDAAGFTTSMNRFYGKSDNVVRTKRGSMDQMTSTRSLLGIDYLQYNSNSTYVGMITYSESSS